MQYTKAEIRQARNQLKAQATLTKLVKKGNRRLHSLRVCAICGRQLMGYITPVGEPPYYECLYDHYHYTIQGFLEVNMCKDPNNCFTTFKNRKELKDE